MRIVWQNDRFEAVDDKRKGEVYDSKEVLKQNGFRWDAERKAWYCADDSRLSGLRGILPCTITPDAFEKYQVAASKAAECVAASRAIDTEVDIPRPKGLEYLPYQKAGIVYALKAFGDMK